MSGPLVLQIALAVFAPKEATPVEVPQGLVRALLGEHKLDEAVEAARRFTVEAPGVDSFVLLGDALYRSGQLDEAKTAYSKALANGESARAYRKLGQLFAAEASRRSAVLHLQRAYELAPDDAEVRWALAQLGRDRWRPEGEIRATTIPLDWDSRLPGRAFVTVRIDGERQLRLLLDTGCSGLVLDARVARKLALSPIATVPRLGIGQDDASEGSVAIAGTVRIGDVTFRSVAVAFFERLPVDADGILGPGIFGEFLVTIDFPGSALRLAPLPPLSGVADPDDWSSFDRNVPHELRHFMPVRIFDGLIYVPTLVNGEVDARFLLDSGSFDNFLTLRLASRLGPTRPARDERIVGISGSVLGAKRRLRDVTLQAGWFRQSNASVLAFDTPELDDARGFALGGVLGWPILSQLVVTIDYRDGLVELARPRPVDRKGREIR